MVTVVDYHSLSKVVAKLSDGFIFGFDTETTGLGFSDKMFALTIASGAGTYYFNFNDYFPDDPSLLDTKDTLTRLGVVFSSGLWCSHNAKFDMQKIRLAGGSVPYRVHCTHVTERILRNDLLDYSLDAVARRYGMTKDSGVDKYIEEYKLSEKVIIPGKKKRDTVKHYERVPLRIMVPYAGKDAELHREIGVRQIESLSILERNEPNPLPAAN